MHDFFKEPFGITGCRPITRYMSYVKNAPGNGLTVTAYPAIKSPGKMAVRFFFPLQAT